MSELGLHPQGSRLVVEPEEQVKELESGLVLPDSAHLDKAVTGRVLAAGPDAQDLLGQRVLYGRYSGTDLTVNGQDVVLLKAEQVLGRLDSGVKVEQKGSLA